MLGINDKKNVEHSESVMALKGIGILIIAFLSKSENFYGYSFCSNGCITVLYVWIAFWRIIFMLSGFGMMRGDSCV